VTALWTGGAFAAPGDHIRAGDLEVIPEIDLGTEYRTNVYREEAAATGAANVLLSPAVTASARGADHEFEFGGDWQLRKYYYVEGGEDTSDAISQADRIAGLDTFDDFSLAAGLDTFRRSSIGFRASDTMAMRNWSVDAQDADFPYTTQFSNELRLGMRGSPGPALEIVPGFVWDFDEYYVPRTLDEDERKINTRNTYGPTLDAKWAFLPRTSLLFQASYTFNNWQDNRLLSPGSTVESDFAVPNSQFFKVLTGVDGGITPKLFAQLLVGWGFADYKDASVPGLAPGEADDDLIGPGVLVRSQLRYDITEGDSERPGTRATIGYSRDFRDSFFTNYVILDTAFAQLETRFADVEPTIRYELRSELYRGEVERNDLVNHLEADFEWWLQDYASLTLGGWWHQRASTGTLVEYDDFQLHLMAGFVY
jgi:hypothetical protein